MGYRCSDFGNWGEIRSLPDVFACQALGIFGKFEPASEAAHPMIHCLQKAGSGGSWGGGGVSIYTHMYIYIYIYIQSQNLLVKCFRLVESCVKLSQASGAHAVLPFHYFWLS